MDFSSWIMPSPQVFLAGKPYLSEWGQSSALAFMLKLVELIVIFNHLATHAKNEGTPESLRLFEEYKAASLEARNNFVHTYIFLFGWLTKSGVNLIFTCVLNNMPEFSSSTNQEVIYSQICQAYSKSLDSLTLHQIDDIKALKKLYNSSNAQFIMETRGLLNFNYLCGALSNHYNSMHSHALTVLQQGWTKYYSCRMV
jgi:hypothetical protein